MTTRTVYDCDVIIKETLTDTEGNRLDVYTVRKAGHFNGETSCQFPQGKIGCFVGGKRRTWAKTTRDSITEVTGIPINSFKHELFCEDENNKEYVVYTTTSE